MLKINSKKLARDNSKNKSTQDTYQIEIDELYGILEESYVPFNEQTDLAENATKKIIKEIEEKIHEGAVYGTLSNMDVNGKRARNNQLINIIEGILRSEHTAASILQIADTSPLKERGARITLLKAGLTKEANSLKGEDLIAKAEEVKSQIWTVKNL